MDILTILKALNDWTFPMLIALILLIRLEKSLKDLQERIEEFRIDWEEIKSFIIQSSKKEEG